MGTVPRDRPRRSPVPRAQMRQLEAENERLQRQLRQQLEQLERERDFIRTIVDAASAVFSIVDPAGRTVRYNLALARLSGRIDDDVTRGEPFWDIFAHPADAKVVR